MNRRIWLSPPHMSGNEEKYIQGAFNTNWIAPLGPNVDGFEKDLEEYLNTKNVTVLNSGTSAIHLALILLGINRGDEVICSTFTFSASANPILYQNAVPIFVDSEIDTWNMNPELLEKAIIDRIKKGTKPKAIISVHLYGMPAKIEEIEKIANIYGIPIIEDAAEALGSRYKGKMLGSFGEISILSFNGNKIITTSGGGALISANEEYIKRAKFLATQARENKPYYHHKEIGYNYRMSNILAGIGRGQLEVIEDRVQARRENNEYYKKKLGKLDGISFQNEPNSKYYSNYWLTTILIDKKIVGKDNTSIIEMYSRNNIESRYLWQPLHIQPAYSKYPRYINGTAEVLFRQGICLPSGSNISFEEKELITSLFEDHIKNG